MSRNLDGDSTQSLIQLSWRKSFECGHPVIDSQHRKLLAQAMLIAAAGP